MDEDIPYLLLTPGPLTTSRTVRQAMLRDYCTWDNDYNESVVQAIRRKLVKLATTTTDFTCVLMQGSGSFSVEATIGSVIPPEGKLLVPTNGTYGQRMLKTAERLRIDAVALEFPETVPVDPQKVRDVLKNDPAITHVAMVHCETTTGILNPALEVGNIVAELGRSYIVDAMSSFGGIPMRMEGLKADYLISSANKCIQGVPGFGFVIASREKLQQSKGWARSLSLDLYDQWDTMENQGGKWRFTSPTHVVRAFQQALEELEEEGGVLARFARYTENQRRLGEGMSRLGFQSIIPAEHQSPIITTFLEPEDPKFTFLAFYEGLKRRRFVIYPGKVTALDTFRIGNIGHVFPEDIDQLIEAIAATGEEMGLRLQPTGLATCQ